MGLERFRLSPEWRFFYIFWIPPNLVCPQRQKAPPFRWKVPPNLASSAKTKSTAIPAKAGISFIPFRRKPESNWIPAFAGMGLERFRLSPEWCIFN
ncbi:MAG: hypothetical protein ACR2QC_05690 [Gammaproteobacteria bacterium]